MGLLKHQDVVEQDCASPVLSTQRSIYKRTLCYHCVFCLRTNSIYSAQHAAETGQLVY